MKTSVAALILSSSVALPQAVRAERKAVPYHRCTRRDSSPVWIQTVSRRTCIGTQGYVCLTVGSGYHWSPFGPQATLFDGEGEQILTHFLVVTPYSLLLNPTWQHSRDSSVVWGQVLGCVRPRLRARQAPFRGCCWRRPSSATAQLAATGCLRRDSFSA